MNVSLCSSTMCALGLVLASSFACIGGDDDPLSVAVTQGALVTGILPPRISVVPVFLVPSDRTPPTATETKKLKDHLVWSQSRYKVMLKNRDTFLIDRDPVVVTDSHNATYWGTADGGTVMQKMLSNFAFDRFNNPYIYAVVLQGVAGGTGSVTMNGGINTGGAVLLIRQQSWNEPNFQSTLQHELGHSFGLNHSWESGYFAGPSCGGTPSTCVQTSASLACRFSQDRGWTIMSYNVCHQTNGMNPAANPGVLLPEDIANLALNKRVFPALYFDPETDLPTNVSGVYRMLAHQGTSAIPGQVSGDVTVTTSFGETFGTVVTNVARKVIRKSNPTVAFDPGTMWHSGPTNSVGWVQLTVQFPTQVTLSGLGVHTQHSGAYHGADRVQVTAGTQVIVQKPVAIDDIVSFTPTAATTWTFAFHSTSGYVLVRGLQFYTQGGSNWTTEIFPSRYPIEQVNYLDANQITTGSGETFDSKVTNAVTGWNVPGNDSQTGFQPTLMWHSGPTNAQGKVSVLVSFRYPVTADAVEVFSQHSGQYHRVTEVQVQYRRGVDPFITLPVIASQATGADATVAFSQVVKAKTFILTFSSTSGYVVIRKLRFRSPLVNGYHERTDVISGPQIAPLN